MKVLASIQARMGSSRLPGKVLSDICGKPMLLWQIERILNSKFVNEIVVSTSISKNDDQIIEFCNKHNIKSYRGSENDVLNRISSTLKFHKSDLHVECFGDSPLIDSQLIDDFINYYIKENDKDLYLSSALRTTYPPGTEVILYHPDILIKVDDLVKKDDPLREHVGYNISRFPEMFNIQSLEAPEHLNYPDIYLEVDAHEDLELIRKITAHFKSKKKNYFSLKEILKFLHENNDLILENQCIKRRWRKFRN